MLWMHRRDDGWDFTQVLPIGKWENIRVEDGKLLADPVFDENDMFAKLIQAKVEKGIVKGASIGIVPVELSDDPKNIEKGQTRSTVTKCELYEASVVDIPSNRNTVKLMSDKTDNEIPLLNNNEMADKKDQEQFTFKSEADLVTYMKEKFGLEAKVEKKETEEEDLTSKKEGSLLAWMKEKFGLQPKATPDAKPNPNAATGTLETLTSKEEEEDEQQEDETLKAKNQEIENLKAQIATLKKAPGAVNQKTTQETDGKTEEKGFDTYKSAKETFDAVKSLFE